MGEGEGKVNRLVLMLPIGSYDRRIHKQENCVTVPSVIQIRSVT